MCLLSASLQLRAYWLFDHQESNARRNGVIGAYDTAIRLVSEIEKGESEGNPQRYLPFWTLNLCFASAVLISKVIHSSYGKLVDNERGKSSFNTVIQIFRKCSVEDNDMTGRVTKILAQLWTIHRTAQSDSSPGPPRLELKSRLFYSIVHDSLWLWREKYGGQPYNGAPKLPPPFMSPESMSAPASASLAPSPGISPTRSESVNHTIQSPIEVPVYLAPSSADQFIPEPGFPTGVDLSQEQLGQRNGLEADVLAWDIGLLDPSAMYFDVPFTDSNMGFGNQSW